jgi:hypothetical protein
MAYTHRNADAATIAGPLDDIANLDAFLIEDESDEFLDRHLAAIRESLSEFRDL